MSCADGFDMWRQVPAGSRFCAKVDSPDTDFMVSVRISTTTGPVTMFGTAALLGGACIDLEDAGYGVQATVRLGAEPATVNLEMSVLDAGGTVIHTCTTQHTMANATANIILAIVPA
jgi:hypothetical protein